jgi:hypothetical protein
MKLGHGNEIKFSKTVGTVAVFALIIEGEETMHITCDTAAKEPMICVSSAANPAVSIATKGRFATTAKLLEDAEGGPLGTEIRVDRKSVYAYVLPRAAVLMGRLLRMPCPDCIANTEH